MSNKEKLERGNKNHTSQNGITLIALIITVIVMLILVGVTINVALNGGLFDKAKDAATEMEKQSIYEQIVMGMKLDNGKINVEETFNEAKDTLSRLSVTEKSSGTNYIVLTVEGKNGTYTYTITDEKIVVGEEIQQNVLSNPVAGTYYLSDLITTITLNEDETITAPAEAGLGDNPTYTYTDETVTLSTGLTLEYYALENNKIILNRQSGIFLALNRNGLEGKTIDGTYGNAKNKDKFIIDSKTGTWQAINPSGSVKYSGTYFYYENVIYSIECGSQNEDGNCIVAIVNEEGNLPVIIYCNEEYTKEL